MAERLYTTRQVAELLGASPGNVETWIRAGWLATERLPGGEPAVSERGLVRFLRDRGIDLEAILTEAQKREAERRAAEDAPPPQESKSATQEREAAVGIKPTRGKLPPQSYDAPFGRDAASRLAAAVLDDALRRGAEEVYLEPEAEGVALRLRVDGRLQEKPHFRSRLPDGLGPRLVGRFEELAGLASGLAGSGFLTARLGGRSHTFHVVARPTEHGDRLAIGLPRAG